MGVRPVTACGTGFWRWPAPWSQRQWSQVCRAWEPPGSDFIFHLHILCSIEIFEKSINVELINNSQSEQLIFDSQLLNH